MVKFLARHVPLILATSILFTFAGTLLCIVKLLLDATLIYAGR